MKRLDIYSTRIPGAFNNVCGAVKDTIYYLQGVYGTIDENILFDLKVALNELVSNAIKHGNKQDSNKFVKITAGITKNEYAFFLIEDEGEGYNYKCLLAKNWEEICADDMKETGRGLLIVKNLCDDIKFNKAGNKVVIIKKLC